MVYVLDMEGKPLMPTTRHGWARRALKSGRAKAVQTLPFTIRLQYSLDDPVLQDITLGIDPGRTNIGVAAVREDGTCLYAAHCETRNRQVRKQMDDRRMHRQASRRGERLRRKRRAKRNGTLKQVTFSMTAMGPRPNINNRGEFFRMLPGCKEVSVYKDIRNTEARFQNRARPEGWLSPTAGHLLRTHLNLVRKIQRILPVSRVSLELNRFSFMEMEAGGKLPHWAYQCGPLYGKGSIQDAISEMQDGKCLLCGKSPIDHCHHLTERAWGGTDRLANLVGLCSGCHAKVHTDMVASRKLEAKVGRRNKGFRALSTLNQIIPSLADSLVGMFGNRFYIVNGWDTKQFREDHGLEKAHEQDAYCIACSTMPGVRNVSPVVATFQVRQYRRHDRALVKRQTERCYYLGKTKVAVNRRKRMDQKTDSLEDWYQDMRTEYGDKTADRMRSRLKVKESQRSYNNPGRLLPGAKFHYGGKTYVMESQMTNGQYYRAVGQGKKNFPAAKSRILYKNQGLVTVGVSH